MLIPCSNWLLNWAIAYATPYMVETGPGNAGLEAKVFFVWGSFCFVCIFFVYMMIYEVLLPMLHNPRHAANHYTDKGTLPRTS